MIRIVSVVVVLAIILCACGVQEIDKEEEYITIVNTIAHSLIKDIEMATNIEIGDTLLGEIEQGEDGGKQLRIYFDNDTIKIFTDTSKNNFKLCEGEEKNAVPVFEDGLYKNNGVDITYNYKKLDTSTTIILDISVIDPKNVDSDTKMPKVLFERQVACRPPAMQPQRAEKPIIYLYPNEKQDINVVLGKPENLIHTYPKYNDGWNVTAHPNGDLIDKNTNRDLYALYWEGINTASENTSEGFIVKGEDTISFLEEKLELLGLNEREANEFIIYWLPKLEKNKYNFIRFQTAEEINTNMPLKVIPKPDTMIRVMMEFKALIEKINVKEQILETPQRKGFVVVEWGGTQIK